MGQTVPEATSKASTSRDPTLTKRQAPRANSGRAGKRAGGEKKRQRSDGSTPTQPPAKKGRPQPQPKAGVSKAEAPRKHSYKQAAERQLNLANVLDQHLFTLKGTTVASTFRGWRYSGEILRISCEDSHSLEWLKEVVGNLPQLWEAAHLKVVQEDCLPRLRKAAIWVPGKPDDLVAVKRRLEVQNSWAKVGSWCLFHTAVKDQPQGRLIVFGIEEEDQANLIARGEGSVMGFLL